MELRDGSITVQVDHEDIKHLMSSGSTTVCDPDADVSVSIKCKDSLQFEVVSPEGEPYE